MFVGNVCECECEGKGGVGVRAGEKEGGTDWLLTYTGGEKQVDSFDGQSYQ